ncbi:hypothetical protein E1818_10725 [Salmonella enterica subsp. enterica serovar Blukwa]|nr:hypothetical protein [Salmonella enterica subsp. enterica serovar Blukwa]
MNWEQARRRSPGEHDLYRFIQAVKNNVIVDLTQNEFDALVILAFNTGVRGFTHSTVLSIINGNYTKDLRSAWYAFRYSQGREMKVFFDGVYITI